MTFFEVIIAFSKSIITNKTFDIFQRISLIAFWVWINLLPFAIDNQKRSDSIREDQINKLWRPLPSQRCTQRKTKSITVVLYFVAVITNVSMNNLTPCMTLIFLGWCYNELDEANKNFVVRNLINAADFVSYEYGATTIAFGLVEFSFNDHGRKWFCIITVIVFTTVHVQNMNDQTEDKACSNKTVFLIIGDRLARWTIALPTFFWSFFCPAFWELGVSGYVMPFVVGGIIGFRILSTTSVRDDKTTFRIWNGWMVMLYFLPLPKKNLIK